MARFMTEKHLQNQCIEPKIFYFHKNDFIQERTNRLQIEKKNSIDSRRK